MARIIMGVLAMVLIYALTVKLPDIAAFVDKLRGDAPKHENDGLYDMYEINGSDADYKENKNG